MPEREEMPEVARWLEKLLLALDAIGSSEYRSNITAGPQGLTFTFRVDDNWRNFTLSDPEDYDREPQELIEELLELVDSES